ncbi:MAG: CHAT domain-containing tetratricopeptide repeat protein [Blastocatellia bacterium]
MAARARPVLMSQVVGTYFRPVLARAWKSRRTFWLLLLIGIQAASGDSRQADSSPAANHVNEQTADDLRELVEGKAVERALSGGEAHSYKLVLAAGQYLHIVVDQRGVDVVVTLFSSDGAKLTEVDSPNGTDGPEPLSWIAETTGVYRLEVHSLEKDAKAGKYEARIDTLRQATTQDSYRVRAEKSSREGEILQAQGTAESLLKALDRLLAALSDWRAVGDQRQEAEKLNSIGLIYDSLDEKQKALDYYNQALPILRQVGDRRGEATTLNNIGGVYDDLGEKQKALDYFNQVLPLRREVGDRRGEAVTLHNIGMVYDSLGEKQKALDYYNRALPILRQVGDRRGEAANLNNVGSVYWSLGEKQKALDYYNQTLPIRREVGDRRGEAVTLHNIGSVYDNLGEKQKALDYYNQVLPLRREVGDRRGEAATLDNLGAVYSSLGEKQKALDYYNRALPILRQVGDRRGEAANLNNVGSVYDDLGEKQKALDYFNQALPIARLTGDRLLEAACLELAAEVERDLGRLAEARFHIEAALDIIESIRSGVIGHDFRSSFVGTVQPYYRLCVDILMQMHKERPTSGFEAAALQASERGRARSLLDLLVESRADIRNGVDPGLLARERSLQQLLAAKKQRSIELASKQETEDERSALGREIDQLTGQYQEVEADIRARSPKYAALTQPQPLDVKHIQQRVLDKDTLLLEYSIGEERSYLWIVSTNSIASYELPKRAELEPLAKYFSNLASGGGQADPVRVVPVTEDSDYRQYALRLSRMLLGPAAVSIGEKRLLIVADGALEYVPFAALPDPSARENEDPENPLIPLLVRHEIVNAPSASAIDVLRNELRGRKPAARIAAVLADPVFSANDPRVMNSEKAGEKSSNTESLTPSLQRLLLDRAAKDASDLGLLRGDGELVRLHGSRTEADAIESLLADGQCKKAVDFEASKITAEGTEIGQYRYVHFGTHGLINPRHPALTGLVLSLVDNKGNPVDGFLAVSEVYNLKLPAEMVVLSACRTALGTEVRGEGLVGLTRGFMYAGAARVVASLWKVYDAATAELMTSFYRGVLKDGKRPVEALRAAQLEMWKQKKYRAPYYWAAFELQGEWR